MKILKRYIKIWWLMSKNNFVAVLSNKFGASVFLTGKVLRFLFFVGFVYFLLKGANNIAGYGINQTIFFFLTFNFIDIVGQFFYREVYRFRPLVVSGNFDLVLAKPISPLFRSLMGGADILDLITIPPLVIAIYFVGKAFDPTLWEIFLYLFLLLNGLLIATAFHIAVLSFGIMTMEIDHTIMIYRDLTNLGRFPIDIYQEPIRGILTYFIPVGIMITLPAKSLMGLVSFSGVAISVLVGIVAFFVSLRFWSFALTKYTSASS